MTRETKVGVVVASSFLILVGIVVASKLRNGDDPSEQQEANKVAAITPPPKKPIESAIKPPRPAAQQVAPQLPTQAIQAPKTEDLLKKEIALAQNQGPPAAVFIPPPVPVNVKNEAAPLAPIGQISFPMEADKKNDNVTPAFPPLPAPVQKKDNGPAFPLPLPDRKEVASQPTNLNDKKADNPLSIPPPPAQSPLPSFPPAEPKQNATPSFPPLAPLKKDEGNLPPVKNANELSSLPAPKKDNGVAPPSPFALPPGIDQQPSVAPLTNPAQPVFPGNPKDGLPNLQPLPKKDVFAPPVVGGKEPTKLDVGGDVGFPNSPPKTIPGHNQELPSSPIVIGQKNDNPTVPSVGFGGVKALPAAVVEHNMKQVDSQVGETSYAQLSKRLYGNDKYADALYSYNRKYGNANLPPTITPGQKLCYPSAPEFLEKEYANLIRTTSVPTIPPTTQNNQPVKLVAPPVTITPPASPSIATVSNPSAGQGRSYVVQSPNGERIRDIAQRTLGNADRWFDIFRINQTLNLQPQFPLPAGTRLQLPAN